VNEGEALFHIARFEEVKEVAAQMEEFANTIIEAGPAIEGEPPIAT
jgi:hypothetical protein